MNSINFNFNSNFLVYVLLNVLLFVYDLEIEYPFVKRLNDGKYLKVLSNKIEIYDSNFESVVETINTGIEINSLYEGYSTTIEQFEDDDEYIIAIIKRNLLCIDKNTFNIKKNGFYSFLNETMIYSILPNEKEDGKYKFYIIYSDPPIESPLGREKYLYSGLSYKKVFFNPNSNTFTFDLDVTQTKEEDCEDIERIFNSTSCILMSYDNDKIINCVYANYDDQKMYSTKFWVDDFSTVDGLETVDCSECRGEVFKIETIPPDKKKSSSLF